MSGVSGLSGARCVGLWWLFDSTLPADHVEAKRRCLECPALLACRDRLSAELASSSFNHTARPVGTWAGELVGGDQRKSKPREHGTDRGYYQHTHLREIACDECLRAHAAVVRARKHAAKVAS